MGVKGNITFLQDKDLKNLLLFCLQTQRDTNSQLFPPVWDTKREKSTVLVTASIEMLALGTTVV